MINSFRGDYYFLSNFYSAPVEYEGITYKNNEAAFQAQKTPSLSTKLHFASLNPSEAKKMGRKVILRKDWEDVKYQIMVDIVHAKFDQNPELKEKLIATGDEELIEGNNWGDKIWGQVNGEGRNLLGHILMNERDYLKEQKREIDL